MISDFSEPGGFFVYENFMSNEEDYQTPIPAITNVVKPGGIFIGVGPEQNFTYVAAFRPDIAFIVDIRRQNMLEHLLYKALFEISTDRADFVSKLFSRKRPAGLPDSVTPTTLFQAYDNAPADSGLFEKTLAAVYDRLSKVHGIQLSDADTRGIEKLLTVFFQGGPLMDYRFNSPAVPTNIASANYGQLMDKTDRDGKRWSYLATETNFQLVREYQMSNRIIPLVGDFAGPKTIRAVAEYAKELQAIVSVFYASNVDEYLYRDRTQDRFFSSLASLPIDKSSVMIRVVGGPNRPDGNSVQIPAGQWWAALHCSMAEITQAFHSQKIPARADLNRICER
jgi:hypothetical protein